MKEQSRDPAPASGNDNRRQLILRGAIATGLIVALLAGLLIVEGGSDEAPAPTARVVTGPGSSISHGARDAVRQSADAPEVRTAADATEASAPAATPEASAPPLPPASSAPVVAEESADPAVGSMLGVPAPPAGARPTSAPPAPPAATATPAKPAAPAESSRLVLQSAPPAPRPARPAEEGFTLQVGVFASHSNAQELYDRLKSNGIPSQLETRVSVGPFKTREEAQAAQQKLARLGVERGIVVPPRK
ncbi:MAG: SPOR domain-containing protein [Moraxellaceae bacterium]|nr:SPOR domain-containing protein [Moraxellaceae bacterium]